jgi:hypothetical protein
VAVIVLDHLDGRPENHAPTAVTALCGDAPRLRVSAG